MSSTIFIAIQCCQCSTMQVKQKKKSGNKWTCAVCNQKQSVRKVFTQGYMAKDIRKFVQSFNMSRNLSDEEDGESPEEVTLPDAGLLEDRQKKRRSDWDEYLDSTEDENKENLNKEDLEEGNDFEPKIVTELPKVLFKKPKLWNYASVFDTANGDDKSYKLVSSNTDTNHHFLSPGKEGKKHQPANVISSHKWNDFMTRDYKEPRTTQPTTAMRGSKWDAYIANDNNIFGRNFGDDIGHCSYDILETVVDDQKVEDDIHPDFM